MSINFTFNSLIFLVATILPSSPHYSKSSLQLSIHITGHLLPVRQQRDCLWKHTRAHTDARTHARAYFAQRPLSPHSTCHLHSLWCCSQSCWHEDSVLRSEHDTLQAFLLITATASPAPWGVASLPSNPSRLSGMLSCKCVISLDNGTHCHGYNDHLSWPRTPNYQHLDPILFWVSNTHVHQHTRKYHTYVVNILKTEIIVSLWTCCVVYLNNANQAYGLLTKILEAFLDSFLILYPTQHHCLLSFLQYYAQFRQPS